MIVLEDHQISMANGLINLLPDLFTPGGPTATANVSTLQRQQFFNMTPEILQVHLNVNFRKLMVFGGSPLRPVIRAVMEDRFGLSFNHVRVHTGLFAAISARVLGARAYTVGSHIFFGEGCYHPETRRGQRLLAHELVHVVKQARGATPAYVDDSQRASLEYVANEAADIIVAGASLPSSFSFGSAP